MMGFRKTAYKIIVAALVIFLVMIEVRTDLASNLFAEAMTSLLQISYGEESGYAHKLNVAVKDANIASVVMSKEGKEDVSQEVNHTIPMKDLVYEVEENGSYKFTAYDAQKIEVSSEKMDVDIFSDITIREGEEITVLSRVGGAVDILVSFQGKTVVVPLQNIHGNLSTGTFQAEDNGDYSFVNRDMNQTSIGQTVSYKITSVLPNPNAVKDIMTISDLQAIANNPRATYNLQNDLDASSLTTLNIDFQGTLNGNGHRLYNMKAPLFTSMSNATVDNLHMQGDFSSQEDIAALSLSSSNTTVQSSSVQGDMKSAKSASGFFLYGEGNTIKDSFVSMKIEAELEAAGMSLHADTLVENSYVSGVIIGKNTAYGFGKKANMKTSYMAAGLTGEHRFMFNQDKNIEESFFDISLNDFDEERATAYTTSQMISGTLDTPFYQKQGSYPQIKEEIRNTWSEETQKAAALSVLALPIKDNENLSSMVQAATLPKMEETLDWKSEGDISIRQGSALASSVKEDEEANEGILKATYKETSRYFKMRGARILDKDVVAGSAEAAKTTTISFNATANTYYKIAEATEEIIMPKTHKEAIDNGWKKSVITGVYNIGNLKWNTAYKVYTCDLTTISNKDITTNKGLIGGKLTLSGTLLPNNQLTLDIQDSMSEDGVISWETSASMSSGWKTIPGQSSTTLPIVDSYIGNYIRGVYSAKANSDFTGSSVVISDTIIKEDISKISAQISGNAMINEKLSASVTPEKYNTDMVFTWYQELGETDHIIYTGKDYVIRQDDIGKQLYVIASAREDSKVDGTITTALTQVIQTKKADIPTVTPQVVAGSVQDTNLEIKLPDSVMLGSYRFGYKIKGSTDEYKEFPIQVRGHNKVVITGLSPSTSYIFKVRRVGEGGLLDSDWGNGAIEQKMASEYIKGSVVLTGNPIYGQYLEADLIDASNPDQSFDLNWYRVKNGVRQEESLGSNKNFLLTVDDIGCYIEVEATGKGLFSGKISVRSEIIQKAQITAPKAKATDKSNGTDTQLNIELPYFDSGRDATDHFIIGLSESTDGVPVEYKVNGVVQKYGQKEIVNLKGLKRDTTYYIYLRYDSTLAHYRSDWSTKTDAGRLNLTTLKTNFTGAVSFTYKTGMKAVQGEKLVAKLANENFEFPYKGTWAWEKINNKGQSFPIANFFPELDGSGKELKNATYFMIPESEEVGTTYKVTYHPGPGFSGEATITSNPVEAVVREKYTAPNAPTLVSKSDNTIAFKLGKVGLEGIYGFRYGTNPDGTGAINIDITAFAGTTVTLTGLQRNTKYYIWSKRNRDETKDESLWSSTKLEVTTDLSNISGYVSIDKEAVAGSLMTASYTKANYTPTGNDENGSWQWYQGTTPIAGATSATYTPTSADITKVLKAVYTGKGTDGFKGTKEALTNATKKEIPIDPVTPTISAGPEANGFLSIAANLDATTYYRLQEITEEAPSIPKSDADLTAGLWTKAGSASINIQEAYNKATNSKIKIKPNTSYFLYIVKAETVAIQASNVIVSAAFKTGQNAQTGSVVMSGNVVVGESITATITGGNNNKGTWKWYMSTTDKTVAMPAITDTTKWTQIASGYYPTVDTDKSVLTISEATWKKYIKAEFVANESIGYTGIIRNNASTFVKKIYDENITITGKGYANETITATIGNLVQDIAGRTMRFKIDNTYVNGTRTSANTYTYVLPNNNAYDGKSILADISTPADRDCYVDKSFKAIAATITSDVSTKTTLPYKSGIPISTADDFEKFMKQTAPYNNRDAASKYVVTAHINMSSKGKIVYSEAPFSGILDGDYHTIVGTKNPVFTYLTGTVKNLIFQNAKVDLSTSTGSLEQRSGAIISNSGYNLMINNVFMVDSDLNAANDTGYFLGRPRGGITITNSGSVGGSVTAASSAGGIIGFLGSESSSAVSNFKNLFSIGTKVYGGTTGGIAGGILGISNFENIYQNSIVESQYGKGAFVGVDYRRLGTTKGLFYDNMNGVFANPIPNETALASANMVGTKLQSSFNDNSWAYAEGFYPRLAWMLNDAVKTSPNVVNVINLYAVTKGAFVSLDGKTSSADLFAGNVNGSIQVPADFQKQGFTFESNNPNVLAVTSGGTITPKALGTATITVTFNDSLTGSVSKNTYVFTVKAVPKSAFTAVTLNGGVAPKVGQTLTASATPATSTFNWYRRKAGSTTKELIGAANATYVIQPKDNGYEIAAEATLTNYQPAMSSFTTPVTSAAPTSAPVVSVITDRSVKLTQAGIKDTVFEFAYAIGGGDKIILTTKATAQVSGAVLDVSGLSRNTTYSFYSRVAGATDGAYAPSDWSPVATAKTLQSSIEGPINVGPQINMGMDLIVDIADTNLQQGTWKMERVNADGSGAVDITTSAKSNTTYQIVYALTKTDVGKKIKFTYTGTGDYTSSVTGTSGVIKKQIQPAPSLPIRDSATDSSLVVKEPDAETGTKYIIGYATTPGGTITPVNTLGDVGKTNITISGLNRNTTYYVHARKAEKDDYEASPWSGASAFKTEKTDVKGTLGISGTQKVNENVIFKAPADNNQVGTWVIERIKGGDVATITNYTISPDTRTLTYNLIPEDGTNFIKATFLGSGDYKSSITVTSGVIDRAKPDIPSELPTVGSSGEYFIKTEMRSTSTDIFQFGYRVSGTSGAITPYEATTSVGNEITITGLKRDTSYDIFARKAEKQGYYASDWTRGVQAKTLKTTLNGNIKFTGTTAVDDTLVVSYEKGVYSYEGTDTGGTWEWFLDGKVIAGVTGNSYKVAPTVGNPEITVKYHAKESDGFTGTVGRTIGNVFKAQFTAPSIPTSSAQATDKIKGSGMHVVSSDIANVYYYIQYAEVEDLPSLVTAAEATEELVANKWVKAQPDMLFQLEANKTYLLYAARLETNNNSASGIVSGSNVLTVKETLNNDILDMDVAIPWKADQEKRLSYSENNEAVSGNWKYYASQSLDSGWQSIDTQIKNRVDETSKTASISKATFPLKYTDYYIKAVFTANGDFEGSKEFISKNIPEGGSDLVVAKLLGKQIKGIVEIVASSKQELLVPINVEYKGDDDLSGIWTWYRETAENSNVFEIIPGVSDTGVTSSYLPTSVDYKRNIYAVYRANPNGLYSGEVQGDPMKQVKRATQNIPDAVIPVQVNGNRIQFTPPTNFKVDASEAKTAQVVIGYKEASKKDDPNAPITWQLEGQYGSTWLKNLKEDTAYVLYAQFKGTELFDPSEISPPSVEIRTEKQSFEEQNLHLTYTKVIADGDITDTGNSVKISYDGDGWEEGYYKILRSNGEVISEHVEANVSSGKSADYTYTYATGDIGTHIIFEFHAKADALYHSGYIKTATNTAVSKPKNTALSSKPKLSKDLDTNLYVIVDETYEYALTKQQTPPLYTSGDWDVLHEDTGVKYEFAGLDRGVTYYLHSRIAETSDMRASEASTSDAVNTYEYIDLGSITLRNVSSIEAVPKAETKPIKFPHTLKDGNITISDVVMKKGTAFTVGNPQNPVSNFVENGVATSNVYSKGTTWGDQNYASDIQLLHEEGDISSSSSGDQTKLVKDNQNNQVKLVLYRGNAVKENGVYTWEALLSDEEGNTALLHAQVHVETQMTQILPIKISMYVRDNEIKQTTNNQVLRNTDSMPKVISLDEKVVQGKVNMPSLNGVLNSNPGEIGNSEVFLKASADGSNFTDPKGIWFRSTGDSLEQRLTKMGANAKSPYYISGIAGSSITWPWDEPLDQKVIDEAYQFKFITGLSEEDAPLYSPSGNYPQKP